MFSSRTKKLLAEALREKEDLKRDLLEKELGFQELGRLLSNKRYDSAYYNPRTGMGTYQDSNESTYIKPFRPYSFIELETLAACDSTIHLILDKMCSSVFKVSFDIVTEDEGYSDKFKKLWKEWGLEALVELAYRDALIFGQAFLILDLKDGEPYSAPLNFKKVKGINSIREINRYFLAPDPTEIDFQFNAESYFLVQQPITGDVDLNQDSGRQDLAEQVAELAREKIHHTKLVSFIGQRLTPYLLRSNLHFHDTYLRNIQDTARDYNSAMSNMSTVVTKTPFPIYKMQHLRNVLSTPEQREQLMLKMRVMEQLRSTNNTSLIDSDEEYEMYTPSLAGYPEILRELKEMLCLKSNIPHDVLFGEGSTGNTSGRTEESNFETYLQSERKKKITPVVEFFMKLFESCYDLKAPADYKVTYEHTTTATPLEESQEMLNIANSTSILADQGFDCGEFITSKYPQIKQEISFSEMNIMEEEEESNAAEGATGNEEAEDPQGQKV